MQKSISFLNRENSQLSQDIAKLSQTATNINFKAIQLIKSKIQPKHKKLFLSTLTPPQQGFIKTKTMHIEQKIQENEAPGRKRDIKFRSCAGIGLKNCKTPKIGTNRYFSNIVNEQQPTKKRIADQQQFQQGINSKYGSFYQKTQIPLACVIQNYHRQEEKYDQKLNYLKELRKKIDIYYHYCQQKQRSKQKNNLENQKNQSTHKNNKSQMSRRPYNKATQAILPKMRQYINLFSQDSKQNEGGILDVWKQHFRLGKSKKHLTLHDPYFIRRHCKQRQQLGKIQQFSQQFSTYNENDFKHALIQDLKQNIRQDKHALLRIKMNHKKIIKIK